MTGELTKSLFILDAKFLCNLPRDRFEALQERLHEVNHAF